MTEHDIRVLCGLERPLQQTNIGVKMAHDKKVTDEQITHGRMVACETCVVRNMAVYIVDPGPCPVCGGPYGSVGQVRVGNETANQETH